jgi:hypothetical protein
MDSRGCGESASWLWLRKSIPSSPRAIARVILSNEISRHGALPQVNGADELGLSVHKPLSGEGRTDDTPAGDLRPTS